MPKTKRQKKKKVQMNGKRQRHVTSRGVEILFSAMPTGLMEKVQSSLEEERPRPEPPTYEVDTAVGTTETHELTEAAVETPEQREQWEAYQEKDQAWQAELQKRNMRVIQLECIDYDEALEEEWEERHAFLGIKVPESKYERKLHFVQTEIVGDIDDVFSCFIIPMRLTGAPEEEVAAMEKMFRAAIRRDAFAEVVPGTDGEMDV